MRRARGSRGRKPGHGTELGATLHTHRSAELHSAVSRICNPLNVTASKGISNGDTLPNIIRRYSRLQIRATGDRSRRRFGVGVKLPPALSQELFVFTAPRRLNYRSARV